MVKIFNNGEEKIFKLQECINNYELKNDKKLIKRELGAFVFSDKAEKTRKTYISDLLKTKRTYKNLEDFRIERFCKYLGCKRKDLVG